MYIAAIIVRIKNNLTTAGGTNEEYTHIFSGKMIALLSSLD